MSSQRPTPTLDDPIHQAAAFLRERIVEHQRQIAELSRTLTEQQSASVARERGLLLGLFEILDTCENLQERVEAKKSTLDKTARRLTKGFSTLFRKLSRLLEDNGIVQIDLAEQRAKMETCEVIGTRPAADAEDGTILTVVRNGYLDQRSKEVVRKAQVITVLNDSDKSGQT